MTPAIYPPGPTGRLSVKRLHLEVFDAMIQLAHQYGDVARTGRPNSILVSHPDYIQDILITHAHHFVKPAGRLNLFLGEGLLTSEGETHRVDRRLLQPMFHRQRIMAYGEVMVEKAMRSRERWQDGAALDVLREMMRVAIAIVGDCFFSTDLEAETDEIYEALTEILRADMRGNRLPLPGFLKWFIPGLRRFETARRRLNGVADRIIAARRGGKHEDDLLSTLMHVPISGGRTDSLSEQHLQGSVLTFLLAGVETIASTLAWLWYLLDQHPAVEARLHAEVDEVLGDRRPSAADLPRLAYTRAVLHEVMRLYPSVTGLLRQSLGEYQLGRYRLPAGTVFILSPYVVQRDARYFADPLRFEPERWTPEFQKKLPRFAYFPFGGGARVCIGEQFATMEGILVLATFAQRWQLRLVSNHPPVVPSLAVTMRPEPSIRMIARRRQVLAASGLAPAA